MNTSVLSVSRLQVFEGSEICNAVLLNIDCTVKNQSLLLLELCSSQGEMVTHSMLCNWRTLGTSDALQLLITSRIQKQNNLKKNHQS